LSSGFPCEMHETTTARSVSSLQGRLCHEAAGAVNRDSNLSPQPL
jgi:hypothetical protein